MVAEPRKHHFVSQCYLKGFSVQQKKVPQICVFDRIQGKSFKTGIDNVAAERDFNRFEIDGHEPNALEHAMSSFETELGNSFSRIAASKSLANSNDRTYLLNFIGLLAIRTPRFRRLISSAMSHSAKITMEMVLRSKDSYDAHLQRTRDSGSILPEVSYDDMKRMFDAGGFEATVNREYHIQQEFYLFETVLPLIFKRGWHLLRAPSSSAGFITSDHPFALSWSNQKMRNGSYAPGLGLRETEIIFPLSSRLAVVGAFELRNAESDVSDKMVASINGATVANAQRQVYARDRNFSYLMQYNEPERKGSRLIDDPHFIRKEARKKDADE